MAGHDTDPEENRQATSLDAVEAEGSGHNQARGGLESEETLLDITRRLLKHETGDRHGSEEESEPSERVCLKLRAQLVDILGTSGFRYLMRRAVATAEAHPMLEVDDNGILKALGRSVAAPSYQAVVLTALTRFLHLLADIIGINLVLRLIHQAWPEFLILLPFSVS